MNRNDGPSLRKELECFQNLGRNSVFPGPPAEAEANEHSPGIELLQALPVHSPFSQFILQVSLNKHPLSTSVQDCLLLNNPRKGVPCLKGTDQGPV